MSRKRPDRMTWLAMFPSDFFGSPDVLDMDGPGRGAYLILLLRSWQKGALLDPVDELVGQRYTRSLASKLWGAVSLAWTETDGGWVQERLEDEREKALGQVKRSKDGHESRWGENRPLKVVPNSMPNVCQTRAKGGA